MRKIRIAGAIIIAALWMAISVFAWTNPSQEMSESERRKLAQLPALSFESVINGEFTSDFEEYTLDQFPKRDTFRRIKSLFHYYVIGQKDNNDIYVHDGYAAKMEHTLNEASVNNAVNKFNKIYEQYIKGHDTNVFMSIVPDKSYYLADKSGHLKIDYDAMFDSIKNVPWAQYIDVTDVLSEESYYHTDTHWRQEKILPVAQRLCEAMRADIPRDDKFTQVLIEKPFYGVYYGQAALPMNPDDLYIMKSNDTERATVYDYEIRRSVDVYNMDAINAKDLYDTYLHGAKAMLRIENKNVENGKDLVVFRDSFGSSIIPLLIGSYETITVIDLRYMSSDLIGKYFVFDDQDVLFLYSSLVLNNSFSFK